MDIKKIKTIISEEINRIINNQINPKKKIFISYGTDNYNPQKFRQIDINSEHGALNNKPIGGLWASPLDSKYGWGKWCSQENFRMRLLDKHFLFKIKPTAKIYTINSINDLLAVSNKRNQNGYDSINVEDLIKNGYDGLFVTLNGINNATMAYKYNVNDLSSWDVESICIFNPNIIIPIEENAFEKEKITRYEKPYDEDDFNDDHKFLQMQSDYAKYGNQNIKSDMSSLFNKHHPGILAQKHGNSKDAKLARNFKGMIKNNL